MTKDRPQVDDFPPSRPPLGPRLAPPSDKELRARYSAPVIAGGLNRGTPIGDSPMELLRRGKKLLVPASPPAIA